MIGKRICCSKSQSVGVRHRELQRLAAAVPTVWAFDDSASRREVAGRIPMPTADIDGRRSCLILTRCAVTHRRRLDRVLASRRSVIGTSSFLPGRAHAPTRRSSPSRTNGSHDDGADAHLLQSAGRDVLSSQYRHASGAGAPRSLAPM